MLKRDLFVVVLAFFIGFTLYYCHNNRAEGRDY